jgi:hypothetical protein
MVLLKLISLSSTNFKNQVHNKLAFTKTATNNSDIMYIKKTERINNTYKSAITITITLVP